MRALIAQSLTVVAALTLSVDATFGQDIEELARMRGVALPPAYWARVAENPDVFTLPNGLFRVPMAVTHPRPPATGSARLPVVLALFSDSEEPAFGPEQIQQSLFDGPAESGTLTQYYTEVSRGLFTVDGDVTPWVRTSLTMATVVGSSFGLGGDAQVGPYLIEALALNDPLIDFGLYDSDGPDGVPNSGDDDGVVDALTFEFLEIAASCGGPSIWPHRSSIAGWNQGVPFETNDARPGGGNIRVNGYIIQGATDCSGQDIQTAATIAHEFGHVLGLPDYYHPIGQITPENRRWVLGCWSLMAAGSWGCGPVTERSSPFGPTHMISWSKHWLGWLDYQEVGSVHDEEFVLRPARTSGEALRIPLDDVGDEYLLVEYRDRDSFDRDTPAEGLLVVHQDFRGVLRPQSGLRYFLSVEEADAGGDLLRTALEGGNRGEDTDAFARRGQPAGRMHNLTDPSTRRNTGQPSTVTIHSMVLDGDVARIRISTAPDPRLRPPEGGVSTSVISPFEAPVPVVGGAVPYFATVQGGAPGGVEAVGDGDRIVLRGEPAVQGVFDIAIRVVDALGTAAESLVRLTVGAFAVSEERLVGTALMSDVEPLTTAEQAYLDGQGNSNGFFDVGDVRAWLNAGLN